MKKRILSLALVTTMAISTISPMASEAARINRTNFRQISSAREVSRFRDLIKKYIEENKSPEEEKPAVEETVGQQPAPKPDPEPAPQPVPEPIPEPEPQPVEEPAVENSINVMDFGAVADANYYNSSNGNYYSDPSYRTPATDATEAINDAIEYASENGIEVIHIPNGNFLIEAEGSGTAYIFEHATKGGIQMQNNTTLDMSEGTVLVTDTVYKGGYSLVTVNNKENVKIRGGKIIGDMATHPANNHNYCYGITIANGSRNVLVENVETTEAEDDGIMIVDYFAHLSGGQRTRDVVIKNVKSHNNGRQGLTISTGSNIKVIDSEFSNQRKHSPMSGIDIELESYDHIGVDNVEITGNTFNGNAYSGIVFSDMFNDQPGSMSRNVKLNNNEVNDSRFGIIVSGKVDGLEIAENKVNIDHMANEFSTGVGSTSGNSRSVTIRDNSVNSSSASNYSLGAIIMTPNAKLTRNAFSGQRKGIVVYSDNVVVSGNSLSNMIEMPFEIIGLGNIVTENQVR